jgi:hypothetical protein
MHHLWRYRLLAMSSILAIVLSAGPLPQIVDRLFESRLVLNMGSPQVIGQNDDGDENEVSSDEIEKYVSVYRAMQQNRNLTVDQAAAAQGLSTKQFRELEDRVQRDDAALQQARDELQAAAKASPLPGESTNPSHH